MAVDVMPFGKYRGTKIANLPAEYVSWFLTITPYNQIGKDIQDAMRNLPSKQTVVLKGESSLRSESLRNASSDLCGYFEGVLFKHHDGSWGDESVWDIGEEWYH